MIAKVYGFSDDLIEIEFLDNDGEATKLGAEFTSHASEMDAIAFSDGTLLSVSYTSAGVWRIDPIIKGASIVEIEVCTEDDPERYTDIAYVKFYAGAFTWVLHGDTFGKLTADGIEEVSYR